MIFGFGLSGDKVIELFEQNERKNERQSSKGNQLKWENEGIWYKADYTGYEGLSEYLISHLLKKSTLEEDEFVVYNLEQIRYKNQVYRGVKSSSFLKNDWQLITLERLFQNFFGKSLYKAIYSIADHENRLRFMTEQVERMTGLKEFGRYLDKLFTIDAFFLNEDRHTHNIAVLMNGQGEFAYCPMFDHGAGLLADTTMEYPLDVDVYDLMAEAQAKTICSDFDEQLELAYRFYGCDIRFFFDKSDVVKLLENAEGYPETERERVKEIVFAQMRKYAYLFSK